MKFIIALVMFIGFCAAMDLNIKVVTGKSVNWWLMYGKRIKKNQMLEIVENEIKSRGIL